MRNLLAVCAALVASAAGAAHAQQQVQAWVSAVGDDANPCTRTAPCATFGAALFQTLAGGEIDALDAGDFGPATITGPITLDGRAAGGSVGAGLSGITIAAGPTDTVIVRGLSIRGGGTGSGVQFMGGGSLQLIDSRISGFQDGVLFTPSAGGRLFMSAVVVKDNVGSGVVVGAGAGARSVATLTETNSDDNAIGVRAIAGARVGLYECDVNRNATAGVSAELDAAGGSAEVNLEGVAATQNGVGISATAVAGNAIVRMSRVLSTANTTAPVVSSGGGAIQSFGNNRLDLVPALALSSTGTTQTVAAGDTATYPIDAAITGLTSAPISFACSGLPPGAACAVSPATLPAGTKTATVTLTVTTTAPTTAGGFVLPRLPLLPLFVAAALALLMALAMRTLLGGRRFALRRALGAALAVGLVASVLAISACGSSTQQGSGDLATNDTPDLGDSGDLGTTPDLATPPAPTAPGTYAFTLTATSGTLHGTLPLSLVVN
ncbi:MAG: hypothetical protein JWM53_7086 [bacterium]|nr:hypothetical protein [bacterium]